jgi:isoprenylcysteine carboxyl methyltransferase (ICMT) family protein YpbQ
LFQSELLFASAGGTLKMEVVCSFRTVSIPSYFVNVRKETIAVPFGLK